MDDCSSKPVWRVMLDLIEKCKTAGELDLTAHLITNVEIKRNHQRLIDAFRAQADILAYNPEAVINCLERRLRILNSEYRQSCKEFMFLPLDQVDLTVRLYTDLKKKNLANLDQVWRESERWSDHGARLDLEEKNRKELQQIFSKTGLL